VRVLFLNHAIARCGVYQMGRRIGQALDAAGVAHYAETPDLDSALALTQSHHPIVIIYNWHPSTLPWAPELIRRMPGSKHVGLMHEIAPEAPRMGAEIFPIRIVCDPSFPTDGVSLFRSVRHVPRYEAQRTGNDVMTVGSFGFAVGGKMFPTIVHAVGAEFPGARVRLRIPHAHYGDEEGALAQRFAKAARDVTVGGVTVEVAHDFLDEGELVTWLASNDLNVFFYEPNRGRGIASVLDYAIAAQRPIAINDSQMFRHVHSWLGCFPERSLRESIVTGAVVEALYETWSPKQLVADYQQMLGALGVS